MKMPLVVRLTLFVLLLFAVGAQAEVITIDGNDNDWQNPDRSNEDPNEASVTDQHDIGWCYYEWDAANAHTCFAFWTYDNLAADTPDNFTRILIDVDNDSATGGAANGWPGAEYFIHWDLTRTSPTAQLYSWAGTTWQQVASPTYAAVGYGDDFIEWAVGAQDIGYPATFTWAAYLDDGGRGDDDIGPLTEGYTPELPPSALLTLTMLPWGIVYLRGRRRKQS